MATRVQHRSIPRTDQEILDRIEQVTPRDPLFGTERVDLTSTLPYEAARPLLKSGVTEEHWDEVVEGRDEEAVKRRMRDYMPFAWDKANGCRGLSAARSLSHMAAWLWLLGWDQAADELSESSHYGKPALRAICEAFGWDWEHWDDGYWTNSDDDPGEAPPETVPPLTPPDGER